MPIKLHNTLSGKLEEFRPIRPGEVGMYNCGPTVYDYVHIGNLRAFLTADIVRRAFEYVGYDVRQVMNITDIGIGGDNDEGEDKMIRGLKREGKPVTMEAIEELASFYTEAFKADIAKLNILDPHVMPRASRHVAEMIEIIEKLEEKGFAYVAANGVYFDTSKDPDYGKLAGKKADAEAESRIGENPEKKSQKDFALWKFNQNLGYQSPWGQGFPGWHIECSAMSSKYLGEHFDIHTGGMDLAPIHHNNEIAQSENACGCKFVNYWIHNEFVNMGSGKMAKSEGNILTLSTLSEKGFSPLSYRYFLMLSHYRTPTAFSWEALQAAQNAYRKLKGFFVMDNKPIRLAQGRQGTINKEYKERFVDAISNDFNTPEALAVVWKLVKDESVSDADKRATLLDFDQVLGLDLEYNEFEAKDIPEEVRRFVQEREEARQAGDFGKSDNLREEIQKLGFEVSDTPSGPKLSKI